MPLTVEVTFALNEMFFILEMLYKIMLANHISLRLLKSILSKQNFLYEIFQKNRSIKLSVLIHSIYEYRLLIYVAKRMIISVIQIKFI